MRFAGYKVVASKLLAETRRNAGFFMLLDYAIQIDNTIKKTMKIGGSTKGPRNLKIRTSFKQYY